MEPILRSLTKTWKVLQQSHSVSKDETARQELLIILQKEAEALEIKSGVVDGEYYDAAGVKVLATIPSKDELISKLLGSLQSPITNFARVVKQIAEAQGETAAE